MEGKHLARHPSTPLLSPYPSFLSVPIRNPNNRRGNPYDSQWKDKRRSKNLDSRLKISGMTREGGRHPGNL